MSRRSRKNLKVRLVGANGRMGKEITKLLRRESGMSLSTADEANVDGVIEFSSPEGFRQTLAWCVKHKIPLVSGTTGLSAADRNQLKKAAKKIPILYSANMSLGVAVVQAMLKQFARIPDWKYRMEEIHHIHKKDKPSGTAKMLAEKLKPQIESKNVPIRALRRGKVPGTHQIEALGPDETILLRHTAHDRRIFARGAIHAARWLFDKGKPGLYDLNDLYRAD